MTSGDSRSSQDLPAKMKRDCKVWACLWTTVRKSCGTTSNNKTWCRIYCFVSSEKNSGEKHVFKKKTWEEQQKNWKGITWGKTKPWKQRDEHIMNISMFIKCINLFFQLKETSYEELQLRSRPAHRAAGHRLGFEASGLVRHCWICNAIH